MFNPKEFEPTEVFETGEYYFAKPFQAEEFADAMYYFGVTPPARILDIGCGEGTMVKKFRSLGFEAYGVESRNIVPVDNLVFFREDARRTHFADNFFAAATDRIVFSQLAHVNKRIDVIRDILKELQRVVGSGGYLFSESNLYQLEQAGIEDFAEVANPLIRDLPRACTFYNICRFY